MHTIRNESKLLIIFNLFFYLFQLRICAIFSNGVNLSGLLEAGEPLNVSEVVYKVVIETDEHGSEAAGSTFVIYWFSFFFSIFGYETSIHSFIIIYFGFSSSNSSNVCNATTFLCLIFHSRK